MMPNVIFLVREVCQSLHTTMRWGEVFVGHNLLCYFGEQSVADGLTPNPLLDDGRYILTALLEVEIVTLTLTNTFDSSEVLVDVETSGNGFWLSDRPQGIKPENGDILTTKIVTALQFSAGKNEIDASVISWTLGNVVHLDAQSAASPHSAGRERISPDLTLSEQWDFNNLKFGDSETLAFKVGDSIGNDVADNVTMLRIEYQLKSDIADPTKINFRLNGLDTIVGVATNSGVGIQQTICVLINHPPFIRTQQEASGLEPESRLLKQTIAVDGATIEIERIRISYYKPDPIVTWEIDGQLTRLRLKNTNFNQVPAGPVPIRWELLSGKPADIFVSLLSWYHGYHGLLAKIDTRRRIFHSLQDISSPIPFDHGIGNGREGVLELLSSNVIHPEFVDPESNLIGVYITPVNNQSNRFGDRDDAFLDKLQLLTDECPAGSTRPVGVSEKDAIGYSTLPGICFGTGEYSVLRPISPIGEGDHNPVYSPNSAPSMWNQYANKSCQIMMDSTAIRLDSIDNFDFASCIKIIKAWISPEEIEDNEWAHAQGRAVDFIAVNRASGKAKPEFHSSLAEKASYLFDWVEHVPANPITGEQAHIHTSRRFEAPTLAHPIIINNDLSEMAEAHWEQVADFDDTDLLDQLINRFPGTSVCEAAFSYRYDLLMQSVDRLIGSEFDSESHAEWKSESHVVIRSCHRFLLCFPRKNGSENVRTLLFKVLRRLEDAYADRLEKAREKLNVLQTDLSATEEQLYALQIRVNLLELNRGVAPEYHEYAVRYPATVEGRLAFARLYSLESERAQRADSVEGYLSFMRDYPDAPQWDKIAMHARNRAVADEKEVIDTLKLGSASEAKFLDLIEKRAANEFRNEVERITDQLESLLVDQDLANPEDRETVTSYSDPNLARYLIETLLRMRHVADKMEDYYPGLLADLGSQINDFMIQVGLVAIQIQISHLSELVKMNHSKITETVTRDGNKTREQMSKSFQTIAAGQAELSNVIETGFAKVQARFDLVDDQLKKIYKNTEEVLGRADQILDNLLVAKEQLDAIEAEVIAVGAGIIAVEEEIIAGNELTREVLTKVGEIKQRSSSGGAGSGGGWLGKTGRWISGGFKKAGKKIDAEVGNLTAANIKSWLENPSETMRKRWTAGKNDLEVEINRGIKAAKSSWWYRQINSIGDFLLLEDPDDIMEVFDPEEDVEELFNVSSLPFTRPNFDANRPVYFVNGVLNSLNEARKHSQYLANLQNVQVKLIYNYSIKQSPFYSTTPPFVPAPYGDSDFFECIHDKSWPASILNAPIKTRISFLDAKAIQANPSARHLAYKIFHDIKDGKDVRVVAHSQGTLICRNALLACQILGESLSKVSCVLAGPALSDREMIPPSQLANLTWLVNRRDWIAPILGMKATIKGVTKKDGISGGEHAFSNKHGNNYGGITGPSKKRTYVRMILPEHLSASSQRGKTVFSVDD